MPTEALVAHVLVSKCADHVPLYRQSRICARQGIDLYRSTLADWVGRATTERELDAATTRTELNTAGGAEGSDERTPKLIARLHVGAVEWPTTRDRSLL